MKSVLLDLDGTIVNTKEGIFNSIKYVAKKKGWNLPDEKTLETFIGPPLNSAFARTFNLTTEGGNEAVECYREYYSQKGKLEGCLYQGISELIKTPGYNFYVATGKPTIFTMDILEHFGIKNCFKDICGSELDHSLDLKKDIIRVLMKRNNLKKEDCIMVGDTYFDAEGAKENGIDFIWADYGFGILEEGHNFKVANSPLEILKFIQV